MRRRLAIAFLVSVVGLVAAAVAFVRTQAAADLACSYLTREGSKRLHGTLTIGRCELHPLRGEMVFHEVGLVVPKLGLTARARRVGATLRELQGIDGRLTLERLDIDRPVVHVAAPGGGAHGPSAPLCQVPPLPFRLVSGSVRHARVDVDLGGGHRLLVRNLTVRTSGDGPVQRLGVTADAIRVKGAQAPSVTAVRARLQVDPTVPEIRVDALSAESQDLRVGFKGSVRGLCHGRVDATVAATGALKRLLEILGAPKDEPVTGRLALTGRMTGPVDRPDLSGSLEVVDGRVGHFRVGDARIAGRFQGDRITIDDLRTDAIGGRLDAKGSVRLAPGLPTKVSVVARGATLEGLVAALGRPGSWAGGHLDARASVSGTLWPPRLAGDARADLKGFRVLDRPVDRGKARPEETILALPRTRVDGSVVFSAAGVEVRHAEIRLPSSKATVAGQFPFDPRRKLDVTVDLADVDLGEIGRVAGQPFSGQLTGTAHLGGVYASPVIDSKSEVRGFVWDGIQAGVGYAELHYADDVLALTQAHGQRGRTPYTLDRFSLRLLPSPVKMDIQVETGGGRVEDVVDALQGFDPIARRFLGARGSLHGMVHLTGVKKTLTTQVDATATGGVLFGQRYRRVRIRGKLVKRRRYQLDEAVANLQGDSRLLVRGYAVDDGALGLSVSARNVPVKALEPLAHLPISGQVSGDLVVGGTWGHPKASGGASLVGGSFKGVALRPMRLQIGVDGTRLHLKGRLSGKALTGTATLDLGRPHAFQVDLAVAEPTLERWIPGSLTLPKGLAGWKGAATGHLVLAGVLGTPESYAGRVDLSKLTVHKGDLRIAADGPVKLTVKGGTTTIDHLVLAGPSSKLTVTGARGARGDLDLAFHGGADLKLLESWLPRVEHASGVLQMQATVSGTFENPVMVGSAHVKGASIEVAGAPLSVSDLSGDIAFSQNRVLLEGLTGVSGRGRVDIGGEVALDRFLPRTLRLAAHLDGVHLDVPEGLHSTLGGEVYVDGHPDDLALTGDLEVRRARWRRDIDIDQLLPTLRRRVAAVPVARTPWMRFDLGIHAPGTIRIENRNLNASLRANLRLTGDDVHHGLVGTVTLLQGRANFRGNEYTITQAGADFKDQEHIVPNFDVQAFTDIRDYRVTVHAFGTPNDPRVVFNSDPELPETDLVTLVTLGVTTRDAEGIGSSDAAAAAADAIFAVSGLDQKVRSFIPKNPILKDPTLRLTSGWSSGTGQVEPRLAFESHLFVKGLKLRYSAPIGIPGQTTQAEYRINNTVSLQAEWDTENRETAVGNVGLDLKLRWEGE